MYPSESKTVSTALMPLLVLSFFFGCRFGGLLLLRAGLGVLGFRLPAVSASASGSAAASSRRPRPRRRARRRRRCRPAASSCSIRASISPTRFCSGALKRPTIVVSGAAIAPSTWPRSTSSDGSVARSLTSSAADRAALDDAAADLDHLRLARGRAKRLRDRDRVAVATRGTRSRSGPRAARAGDPRPAASAARRVSVFLTTWKRAPCFSSSRAQRVDLRHRQAAVVGDDQRLARAQPLGQLGDDLFLLGFVHVTSSGNDEPARRRAGGDVQAPSTPPRPDFCARALPAVFGGRVSC